VEEFKRGVPTPKPSRTARKKAKRTAVVGRQTTEATNKRAAKKRDGHRCRFPLCGCAKLKLRIESSHDAHKGMGGNPAGDRSLTSGLMTLCVHRHQDGIISRHKGTLRAVYLTDRGSDGPVAWEIDGGAYLRSVVKHVSGMGWMEVAREVAVQRLAPLTEQQRSILEDLAGMDI
jgi:hypothetical protein